MPETGVAMTTSNNNGHEEMERKSSGMETVVLEEKRFELAQRKAAIYAKSSLVPKEYQNNIGNVLIAENMAHRMGADTLMVMQNLYIVHGKPGWSAVFLIGSFNSNGRFSAIKYRFTGEPNTDEYGCTAWCRELSTGDEITGTTITRAMAKKEGWFTKNGSKWQTMEDQMMRYRAATFLIRSTAPEIGLGLLTKEELEDMEPGNGGGSIADKTRERIAAVKELIAPAAPEAGNEEEAAPGQNEPADYVDASILDEPEDSEPDEAETDPTDQLRANVKAAYDELSKPKQKDLMAGRSYTIATAGIDDLNQLVIDLRKAAE